LRDAADVERIERLARELGRVVAPGTRMYLTGGATAVLEGWRSTTVDIDIRFEPDSDAALRRIADLKEELQRGFELDLADVASMVEAGQVEPEKLRELFEGIEEELFRFPAVDPSRLRAAVESLA
jgi:hypothetical protein